MKKKISYSKCCGEKIVSVYLDEFRSSKEALICTKCGEIISEKKKIPVRAWNNTWKGQRKRRKKNYVSGGPYG